MVYRKECFETKFGSLHKTEKAAKEAEKTEERHDFADKICEAIAGDTWGYWNEFGEHLYGVLPTVLKVIDEYDFVTKPARPVCVGNPNRYVKVLLKSVKDTGESTGHMFNYITGRLVKGYTEENGYLYLTLHTYPVYKNGFFVGVMQGDKLHPAPKLFF